MKFHLLIAAVLLLRAGNLPAQGLKSVIPEKQEPVLRTFPPSAAEQAREAVGKFVIFTRTDIGKKGRWDFMAEAWEGIPSRPEVPLTKRVEFCHSYWEAKPLLNDAWRDGNDGRYPQFVRLQVNSGDRDYSVNLYDINYQTWEVRCLWQGKRLGAFGLASQMILCESSEGWLALDGKTGRIEPAPFVPLEVEGKYWLVRKAGEQEGCWSYNADTGEYIGHFGQAEFGKVFFTPLLSSDGKNRAVVLSPLPQMGTWRNDGTIPGSFLLQRDGVKEAVVVPIEIQAREIRGTLLAEPKEVELKFLSSGEVECRARKEANGTEDAFWRIDVTSGKVTSGVKPHEPFPVEDPAFLDGVPVPEYLRKYVRDGHGRYSGRGDLALAFLSYLGMPPEHPEIKDDYEAGASRDGRHVLYAAKKGPLAGWYIYGDLVTREVVWWKAPEGLNRAAQTFVWVGTEN